MQRLRSGAGQQLAIASAATGTPITDTSGTGLPTTVVWDGRDASQQIVTAGAYSYTLVVTASNGLAAGTAPQTVTVVSGLPPAPIITEPVTGTNTSFNQIWLAGTAEPGSTVAVFDTNGHFTDTVQVNANGDWGLTRSLVGGTNTLYAVAENAYGVGPASNQVVVNLVPTPPLYPPTIVLPATVHSNQVVTFSALARNNKPQEGPPTTAVTATLLSTVVELTKTFTGNPESGSWESAWTVTGLNNGDYRVVFSGVDEAGTLGHGESTLRVQDPPPAPVFYYPTTTITRSNPLLTVSGAAQPFTTVRLYRDGVLLTAIPLQSRSAWQTELALAEGSNVITATATDQFDQVSPPATSGLIVVDSVAPTATLEGLPPYHTQLPFDVTWSGSDPAPGTGVLNYDLQHRYGSGQWETLL
ncbi:MAG: hypothetical protein ACE5H9_21880, partial [Anaerolineae bacterium]